MWANFVFLLFVTVIGGYFWYSFRFSKVALEIDDISKKDNKMKTFLWIAWTILWVVGSILFGYLIGFSFFSILANWS